MKLSECKKCILCETRKQVVKGNGNKKSKILLIGEAPGRNEDNVGIPFVGSAGKVLNKVLKKNGIERKEIYITNVVKCKPPGNRDPFDYEKEKCKIWLEKEIKKIKPRIIVTLGKHAFNSMKIFYKDALTLLEFNDEIDFVYGIIKEDATKKLLVRVLHPAATLYNSNLLSDFEMQIGFLQQIEDYFVYKNKRFILKKIVISRINGHKNGY